MRYTAVSRLSPEEAIAEVSAYLTRCGLKKVEGMHPRRLLAVRASGHVCGVVLQVRDDFPVPEIVPCIEVIAYRAEDTIVEAEWITACNELQCILQLVQRMEYA